MVAKRRVLASDGVHAPDEIADALRRPEVPVPDLVLLGVGVLLAARQGGADAELERRAVDAVAPGERRGEHEADLERRRTSVCRNSGRMSGVLAKTFGRM